MSQGPQSARTRSEGPSSAPRSGERSTDVRAQTTISNPVAGASFCALRDLRREFGRGGLPAIDERTPGDEARIVVFFVLQELTHILDQFRRAVEQGEPCHLVVREHGRQLGKVVVEVAIERRDP